MSLNSEVAAAEIAARREAPDSLVTQVIEEVRSHIRINQLTHGMVLPSETTFAEKLGVSRAVAREAFRALAALKIIDAGNGRRARVAVPDASVLGLVLDHTVQTRQISYQQILDVRRTIEMRTVALAVLRRTDEEAAHLIEIVNNMRNAFPDTTKIMEWDIRFHEAIAQASRNPLFAMLVGSFSYVTRQNWHTGWRSRPNDESRRANLELHGRLAEAIAARNATVAEATIAEHFDSAVKVLINAGIT